MEGIVGLASEKKRLLMMPTIFWLRPRQQIGLKARKAQVNGCPRLISVAMLEGGKG